MRIGMISSPVPGHIHPMSALGRELKKQGHEIFFFNIEDTRSKIEFEGHAFIAIGNSESHFPAGSWEKYWIPLSKRRGLLVVLKTIALHTKLAKMMVREIPALAQELKLDGLLVDQIQFQGKKIAELANLPFINVACALHMNRDLSFRSPPPVSKRRYGGGLISRIMNRIEWAILERVAAPLIGAGDSKCKNADETYSELAQIFPMPESVDFPAVRLSTCIHYVGNLIDLDRGLRNDFPFHRLTGKPLIYASLGTLQNGITSIYETIALACAGLDAQVVLALGQWRKGEELPFKVSDNIIVVDYAPQLQLLAKSSVVITHAGMNTVFESLSFGVPMVAIPIANDQPAVARRLERAGVAEVVPVEQLTVTRLKDALIKVMGDDAYRIKAKQIAIEAIQAGGVVRAAEIVETKFKEHYAKQKN